MKKLFLALIIIVLGLSITTAKYEVQALENEVVENENARVCIWDMDREKSGEPQLILPDRDYDFTTYLTRIVNAEYVLTISWNDGGQSKVHVVVNDYGMGLSADSMIRIELDGHQILITNYSKTDTLGICYIDVYLK